MKIFHFTMWGVIFCLLVACSQEVPAQETVTPQATATTEVAILVAEPTHTPTPTPTPTLTATPEPSFTPTQTPMVEPTATATVKPTAVPLTILQPNEGSDVELGHELLISGQIQPGNAETLDFVIEVVALPVLTGTIPVDTTTGEWQTHVMIPLQVNGPGQLTVQTPDGDEVAQVMIDMVPDGDESGLTLTRPFPGDILVAGYTVFLEGRVRQPVNDTIAFGILIDNCTTYVAGQILTVTGGAWRGVLTLPQESSGPACAVASTGVTGEETWRESRVPLTILETGDPAATMLVVGNSVGFSFQAGQTATVYGLAVHSPDNQVRVVIALDDGTVLAEGIALVDIFGYWEIDLALPGQTGTAVVAVSMGEGDTYKELLTATTITP